VMPLLEGQTTPGPLPKGPKGALAAGVAGLNEGETLSSHFRM
jgi:hypothetical protein